MDCQNERYTTTMVKCRECRCTVGNVLSVCLAYEVTGTSRNIPDQPMTLKLLGRDGDQIHEMKGTSCGAHVSVAFEKDKRMFVQEHVAKKAQDVQKDSRENNHRWKTTEHVHLKEKENENKNNILPSRVQADGKSYFQEAFFVTLITSLILISFVCLAIAIFIYKKRLRKFRGMCHEVPVRPTDSSLSQVENVTSVAESEYATIEETMDKLSELEINQTISKLDDAELFAQELNNVYLEPKKRTPSTCQCFEPEMYRSIEPYNGYLETKELSTYTHDYSEFEVNASSSIDAQGLCDSSSNENEEIKNIKSSQDRKIASNSEEINDESDNGNVYFQLEDRKETTVWQLESQV